MKGIQLPVKTCWKRIINESVRKYEKQMLEIYLTTLPTSPIVFLLYFKNGYSNQIQLLTIDSTFHGRRTDVKFIENDSELFSILAKI